MDARQELTTFAGHSLGIMSVAFSHDGGLFFASASKDHTIRLWDLTRREELNVLHNHSSAVVSVAFFRPILKSSLLQAGIVLSDYGIWSRGRNEALSDAAMTKSRVWVAFSPDGKMLAVGNWDHTIRLCDVNSNEELVTLKGHSGSVSAVAFSPDGQFLASASWDNTIRLWDVAQRKELKRYRGHSSRVESVSFSPDGRLLASGSEDKTVRLWDVQTGRELVVSKGQFSEVNSERLLRMARHFRWGIQIRA